MPEKEMTRRQKLTIRMLQEAYVDLLERYDAAEISIVMLCNEADVNRTTFYRYFQDLVDFREKITASIFSDIFSILGRAADKQTSSRKKILYALNVTIKNKRLLRHLLCDGKNSLADYLLEENLTLLRLTTLSTGCTPEEAGLCYSYLCGGLARFWTKWISTGCSLPKEKAALIIEEILNWYYSMLSSGFILQNPAPGK